MYDAVEPTRGLVFVRRFAAPPESVFRVRTEQAELARWWGPRGFTNPVCEIEARPGGRLRIHMAAPGGAIYPCRGEVREARAPERLVFAFAAGFWGVAVVEALHMLRLEKEVGGTRLILAVEILGAAPVAVVEHLSGMEKLWDASLDRLGDLLEVRPPSDTFGTAAAHPTGP